MYDTVKCVGVVEKIDFSKSLLHFTRKSHERHTEAFQKRREEMKSAAEAARQKRHSKLKLKELAQKKQKLLDGARKDEADLLIVEV